MVPSIQHLPDPSMIYFSKANSRSTGRNGLRTGCRADGGESCAKIATPALHRGTITAHRSDRSIDRKALDGH
jgi:hypothetical protein